MLVARLRLRVLPGSIGMRKAWSPAVAVPWSPALAVPLYPAVAVPPYPAVALPLFPALAVPLYPALALPLYPAVTVAPTIGPLQPFAWRNWVAVSCVPQ